MSFFEEKKPRKKTDKDKKKFLPNEWPAQKRRETIGFPPKGMYYDPKVKEGNGSPNNAPYKPTINDALKYYIDNPDRFGMPSSFDLKKQVVLFDMDRSVSFDEVLDNYMKDSGKIKEGDASSQWGQGGFYDSPNPSDLGKEPKGDFPCLSGDTCIELLDGSSVSLETLFNENRKNFFVYSISDHLNVHVGFAEGVKKTGINLPTVKVILDNGEYFICTPDHKVMLRDGSYKEARELKENDSLMPIYKTFRGIGNKKTKYERVYNPKTNKHILTHRIVGIYKYGNIKGKTLHHVDFNPLNNSPDNLLMVDHSEHRKIHRRNSASFGVYKTPEFRAKISEIVRDRQKNTDVNLRTSETMKKLWNTEEYREKMLESRKDIDASTTLKSLWEIPEFRERMTNKKQDYMHTSEYRKIMSNAAKKRFHTKDSRNEQSEIMKEYYKKNPDKIRSGYCINNLRDSNGRFIKKIKNHKVKKVMPHTNQDVYDIVGVFPYHNFALSCGVFVHNSMPWLPRGTEDMSVDEDIITGSLGLSAFDVEAEEYLTQDQRSQIAAEYGPEYISALTHYYAALVNGHPEDRAQAYAIAEMEKMHQTILPGTLSEIAEIYTSGT